MSIKQADIKLGLQSEIDCKPLIEEYFGCEFDQTVKYHPFDYISSDGSIYVELKTRNNSYKAYPSSMIPFSKIVKGKKLVSENKKVYYFFKFTDGLYYYNQTENIDDEITTSKGGRNDRGRPEYATYAFIPINILSKLKING